MKLYSTQEAADYVGLSLQAMKYHVYIAKNITGQLVGNSRVFTQDELDQFKAEKRPQGRPTKQE
jgi:hypothetical protein